ncbi:hypothetical protein GALL_297430 [mine drainage metagenome]|uniref:Uncharacterized protein n=1 Tax=mine drainage metagenome TaxID=410659 RepID=A0A1J5QXF9_9ZZZZ
MAITDIPVALTEAYFVDAAEDFQKEFKDGEQTKENRTSYDGESYMLDVQIWTYVTERGLRAITGQVISVEVPIEGAQETLKKIRALPVQTPVRFASVTARSGISGKGKLYTMWTGTGMEPARASAQVPAQRAAQA